MESMKEEQGVRSMWRNVGESIRDLPLPVKRVCYGSCLLSALSLGVDSELNAFPENLPVQFFSWTSWFPFLFYSTTYVSETLFTSLPLSSSPPPSPDTATRAGSLALLLYALVALLAGALLPWISTLGRKGWVDRIVSRRSRVGKGVRRLLASASPRNFWTIALGLYAIGMVGTFFVRGVKGAMVVVAFCGVPWAVTCWVSFVARSRVESS